MISVDKITSGLIFRDTRLLVVAFRPVGQRGYQLELFFTSFGVKESIQQLSVSF